MSRDWASRGFAPTPTPPPAAYLALVAFFDDDPARADAWLAGQLTYTGDAATAEQLLIRLEALGDPSAALVLTTIIRTEPDQSKLTIGGRDWSTVTTPNEADEAIGFASDFP